MWLYYRHFNCSIFLLKNYSPVTWILETGFKERYRNTFELYSQNYFANIKYINRNRNQIELLDIFIS
jgi:hypothetical protein